MENHPRVGGGDAENLTDLLGRKTLNLPEHESHTLTFRSRLQTIADLFTGFLCEQNVLGTSRRPASASALVEAVFEDLVDVVHPAVLVEAAPRLLDLAVENAKDPGAYVGSAFEA